MVHFDATVAAIHSKNHAYDIIALDYKKAFDRAPHNCVVDAISSMESLVKPRIGLQATYITARSRFVLDPACRHSAT
jgi:hypothetical protein